MTENAADRRAGVPGLRGTGYLADDLYLIAHHERTGRPLLSPRAAGLGLAGALLAELVLARFGPKANGRIPEHLVAVISNRAEISEPSASLVNTARQDWMTLENLSTEMPLTEDFAQPPLPGAGGLVRCRSIYEASIMDDPAGRRIIRACAEAGEHARLLPKVPMKLKLADYTTAMLPLTPAGTAGAAADPRAGDHRRVAGVLRDAVGTRHPARTPARHAAG